MENETIEREQTNEKIGKPTYFIHLLFFAYFAVLIAERLYSLIASGVNGVDFFGSGFNGYVYMAAILSIAAAVCYLLLKNITFFAAPFTFSKNVHDRINMRALCVASGIVLISGMVHTEYTVAPVQFVAYGALIVAMIIQTALSGKTAKNRVALWLSVVYLTCFSMAIPVMYTTTIENYGLFYSLEAFTSAALVACFTYMLIKIFDGTAEDLFLIPPILLAAAGVGAIVGLTWNAEPNMFAFIFLCVSAALWIFGFIYVRVTNRKNENTETSEAQE